MTTLSCTFFGTLQINENGRSLTGIESQKGKALLAYLAATTGQSHKREVLALLLWPEEPTAAGRKNLRQALYNLRRALPDEGNGWLETTRQEVQFLANDKLSVDTVQFTKIIKIVEHHLHPSPHTCPDCAKRLTTAVHLYQGEFLSKFSLPDSDTFNQWQALQRETYHAQMMWALTHLALFHERQNELDDAIRILRRQVELEPWREESHRRLMQFLAQQGQRAAALQQYEICRQQLADTLHAEPEAATIALFHQIESGETLPTTADTANPYKGLDTFSQEDAVFFFGRTGLARNLQNTLPTRQFMGIIGPSGSGKSSLVHAGLLPMLNSTENSGQWQTAVCRPGDAPFNNLLNALLALFPETHTKTSQALRDTWHNGEPNLPQLIEYVGQNLPKNSGGTESEPVKELVGKPLPLLLIVDQFEELYTLTADRAQQQQFIDLLLTASQSTALQCHVLITLRADFTAQATAYRPLADALQQGSFILGPMTRSELTQAIIEPARLQGITIEPGLVTRLLDDVGNEPGNLPLLSFTLAQLWQKTEQHQLTHATYDELGQVAGAVAQYANQVYDQLDETEQQQARHIFTQLVQPGRDTADTRRPATRTDLGETIWRLVPTLADARLVITNQNSQGDEMVELVHEALITHWDRLQAWLEADRTFHLWQRQLRTLRRQWQENIQDNSTLLHGVLLAEAEGWLHTRQADLNEAEQAFINASLAQQQAQQQAEADRQQHELAQAQALAASEQSRANTEARARSRLRGLLVGLVVLLLIAFAAAFIAFNERQIAQQAAEVAQSLNLSTSAQLALSQNDTDLSLALALEANDISDPPSQVKLMLAEAAYAPGARQLLTGHEGAVQDVVISPDGKTALSASEDGTMRLWDLASGETLRTFTGHNAAVKSVDMSPDGKTALSASADETLRLWDLASGEILRTLTDHSAPINRVLISPDGKTALSAADDHLLILWDVASGEPIRQFEGHTDAVLSAAISPDGQLALSGGADRDVILWDFASGEILHRLAGNLTTDESVQIAEGHHGAVWDVAFTPDGKTAYSISEDEITIRWQVDADEIVPEQFRALPASSIYNIAMSHTGDFYLVGLLDSRVAQVDTLTEETTRQLLGHTGRVLALDISPDDRFAISGSTDGNLRLWNLEHGAAMRNPQANHMVEGFVNLATASLDLSPDGRYGATGHWDGKISLWDYETGEPIRTISGHDEMLFAGTLFTPDGTKIVSGSGDIFGKASDNTVRVWDVETGEELQRFEGHGDKLWDIDVSSNGRYVVSGSHDGTLRRWDLETEQGEILLDVAPQAVRSVAFSPDGKTILAGLGKGSSNNPNYDLRLLDMETGEELARFVGHTEVVDDIAFSPDGTLALSGSGDTAAILWDVETGTEIKRLPGHTSAILSVTFSPDGTLAASGSQNKVAIVWDVASGEQLRRFTGHGSSVVDSVFTPNGRSLLTSASEQGIHEWRIDGEQDHLVEWIELNRFVPELTCEQQIRFNMVQSCE